MYRLTDITLNTTSFGDELNKSQFQIYQQHNNSQLHAELISDDYAVQNIATLLKIPYKTDLAGIREIIH